MTDTYYERAITPAPSGFGAWQCGERGEGWDDLGDLLDAARDGGEVYTLGVGALPVGVEDIRGRIDDEPEHVYWYQPYDTDLVGDGWYFGVESDAAVASCQDCDCADPTAVAGLASDCDCSCHAAGGAS